MLALVAGCATSVVLTGCTATTTLVHQPSKTLARKSGERPAKTDVKQAVLRALAARKWTLVETGADYVTARVSRGEHSAIAKIAFGDGTYRITHVDSSVGLRYDGQEIHHRYNHWIRRLEASIIKELNSHDRISPIVDSGELKGSE